MSSKILKKFQKKPSTKRNFKAKLLTIYDDNLFIINHLY